MPIKIPENLPAYKALKDEGVMVLSEAAATNITWGGSSAIALKYEYGAKFTVPFLSIDEIQPIGLGNINDLKGSIDSGLLFGS